MIECECDRSTLPLLFLPEEDLSYGWRLFRMMLIDSGDIFHFPAINSRVHFTESQQRVI